MRKPNQIYCTLIKPFYFTKIGKIRTLKLIHNYIFCKLSPKKPYYVNTKFGMKMKILPEPKKMCSFSSNLAILGVTEKEITNYFINVVKPGDICLDLGASIGWFTLLFSYLTNEKGKVYSFEPRKDIREILKENVQLNNFNSVIISDYAIADRKGKRDFYIDKDPGKDSFFRYVPKAKIVRSVKIKTINLDGYFPKKSRIDFIKMDIEGAEYLALRGAKRILKENPHLKIICEAWNKDEINKIKKELPINWKVSKKLNSKNYLIEKN